MKVSPAPSVVCSAVAPFLVVTPLGLVERERLLASLVEIGLAVEARQRIHPWSEAATALYARGAKAHAEARARAFEARWVALFPADEAERWELRGDADYALLRARKRALRFAFPSVPLADRGSGDEPQFRLHAFHVPDRADLTSEAQRLARFCTAASRGDR